MVTEVEKEHLPDKGSILQTPTFFAQRLHQIPSEMLKWSYTPDIALTAISSVACILGVVTGHRIVAYLGIGGLAFEPIFFLIRHL